MLQLLYSSPSLNVIYTTKHSRILQRLVVLAIALFGLISCSRPPNLPDDSALLTQWQQDQAKLIQLMDACEIQETTSSLKERYLETDKLITPNSLDIFGACALNTASLGEAYSLQYLGKAIAAGTETSYLIVTHQHREGTGLIEEAASRWTSGWVSWKSSILEEKGFIHVPDGNLTPLQTMLPSASLSDQPLDQFSGEYRPTSQISGNSSCEIWRIRPFEPAWALFYHQTRECPT
ncbi:MAG: hypothetical protein AAGJ69_03460 [Cyanobacteria bacterium J06559_1]